MSVVSDSVRPHRWQPARLPHPWDSPGKNTGVGCHFLLQCMNVKNESEVAQWCLTLSDPMDCSLPGSSLPGIFLARVLELGAIALSEPKYGQGQKKKFFFFFLVTPCSMWYFSSCDQDKHMCPAVEACSPNHWTTNKITVILYTNLAKTCLERLGLLVISGL